MTSSAEPPAALEGNLEKEAAKLRARASSSCATGSPCCSTRARSSRARSWRTRWRGDLPADGVVTGVGTVDGRPVCVMANDSTVKAGSWGARTVEKIVRLTEYALEHEVPGVLAGRLGRRAPHRPGRAVPRSPGRRPHLLQPEPPVGTGAADLLPVRSVGRGRCVHPRVLRRRDHGRGQRVDVPRARRAWSRWWWGSAPRSRRWAARACTPRCRGAATTSRSTTPTPSRRPSAVRRTCRRAGAAIRRPTRRAIRCARSPPTSCPPTSASRSTCTMLLEGLVDADSFFEVKPLFAPEVIVGFGLLEGRPVGIVASNPVHKGGALFVDSADKAARFIWCCDAFDDPARVPRRRARVHGRHRGRAPGHHPPRRQDDHRGVRGDGAEGVGDRAQGVRRRALRVVGSRVRPDALRRARRPRRSR